MQPVISFSKPDVVLDIKFGAATADELKELDMCKIDTSCVGQVENFYHYVDSLLADLPFSDFDYMLVGKSSEYLNCRIQLVSEDYGVFDVIIKQVNDCSDENVKFLVDRSYFNNTKSASYWLGCLLK